MLTKQLVSVLWVLLYFEQVSKLKINLEISTGKVDGIERLAGHSGPIDVYDRSFRLVELQVRIGCLFCLSSSRLD